MNSTGPNTNLLPGVNLSAERRAWVGGFLFGLTGVRPDSLRDEFVPPIVGHQTNSEWNAPGAQGAPVTDRDHPWHHPDLPIVDRMELAKGKPVQHRLMAAMAQLDCGACGYVCETYSQAIASGDEPNLTLCSPGGKETGRMIRQVLKESGGIKSTGPKSTGDQRSAPTQTPSGWSRQNPFSAKLIESRPLNKIGSDKDTRHVAIDLTGSTITYNVGDALGVFPTNCPQLAAMIIRQLSADPAQTVELRSGSQTSLAHALLEHCCLRDPSDELLELLIRRASDTATKASLQSMLTDGIPEGCDVLDVLATLDECRITPAELVMSLAPMNPRLYSIASSMKWVGNQVHLTVGKVTYQRNNRTRKGVASTMLADRIKPGEYLRVFVQPNHTDFTVPQNTAAPMIMIGPGTGIAPFIAFLQERSVTAAPGKNWLFFGDQHAATDYLYEKCIQDFVDQDILTRIDTAFSRDGKSKVYVQDRMLQNAPEFWRWLRDGAYVFVCGDAARMARDVHQTLIEIISQQGNMSPGDAGNYLNRLSADGRYVRDVY